MAADQHGQTGARAVAPLLGDLQDDAIQGDRVVARDDPRLFVTEDGLGIAGSFGRLGYTGPAPVWYRRAPLTGLTVVALASLAWAPAARAAQPTQPAKSAQPTKSAQSTKSAPPAKSGQPAESSQSADLLRPIETRRATGDLDAMVKRRHIRVLLVYNKTFYFLDRGRQRGATYDFMRAFEDDLNRRLKTGNLRVHVVFIPVGRDELISGLVEGRGDIAAGNLTITDERREKVDFSDPIGSGVSEIVVTGPGSPRIQSPQDLSGQEVFVRKSSSYYESLQRLNAELEKAGKPPVRLKLAPETLEDEDLLEMVNAGLVRIVVVDDHKAEFWTQIFPKIKLHPEVDVRA